MNGHVDRAVVGNTHAGSDTVSRLHGAIRNINRIGPLCYRFDEVLSGT
ncbi:MAG: hypothetical protein HOL77_01460 [Rhodobacteraceae bacterium]|nr:hypothetical protein [Paracoccaceae bacterium]